MPKHVHYTFWVVCQFPIQCKVHHDLQSPTSVGCSLPTYSQGVHTELLLGLRPNNTLVAATCFAFIAHSPAVASITWVSPTKSADWQVALPFLQARQVTAKGEQLVEPLWYVLTCLNGWHSTLLT